METTEQIILYSTDGCHLCEQAIGMFYYVKQQKLTRDPNLNLTVVDIVDDDTLVAEYGEAIPVFLKPSVKSKLFWPIELEELIQWLNASS